MARLSYIVTIIGITLMCILAEELYSDDFNFDPLSMLENDNLRNEYYGCFMGTVPCLTEGEKYFAGIAREILQTKCRKCSPELKEIVDFSLNWYKENRPDEYQAIIAKYVEDMKR